MTFHFFFFFPCIFETGSLYVAQRGLKLTDICLAQPPMGLKIYNTIANSFSYVIIVLLLLLLLLISLGKTGQH